jgi:two-component system CheB/CheR fusion protein
MSAPLRILVVEDHEDTRKYLCVYLQGLGHSTEVAANVAEALQRISEGAWDVVISDLGLPDGTGWEMLHRAHLPASVYTIAMSGFGSVEDVARSKAAGFHHHLTKPFDPEELDRCLVEACSTRE